MAAYEDLMEIVTFRPMQDPLRKAGARRASPFSASWSHTVALLARELNMLKAKQAVMEIDLREQDFRQDGMPRANRTASTPGIVLSFVAMNVYEKPQLRYEVDTFWGWQDNVRAIALGLEALRAVDRYGITKLGEQYKGWKALSAGSVGTGGNVERGRELIRKAGGDVREAQRKAHPDHGGKANDFRDVIAARDARGVR